MSLVWMVPVAMFASTLQSVFVQVNGQDVTDQYQQFNHLIGYAYDAVVVDRIILQMYRDGIYTDIDYSIHRGDSGDVALHVDINETPFLSNVIIVPSQFNSFEFTHLLKHRSGVQLNYQLLNDDIDFLNRILKPMGMFCHRFDRLTLTSNHSSLFLLRAQE